MNKLVCFLFLISGIQLLAQDLSAVDKGCSYLNQYAKSSAPDYNILLLSKYIQFKYDGCGLLIDLKTAKPTYEDNNIAYNFYNPLIGEANKENDDSLTAVYSAAKGIERLLLWGIYADKFTLQDEEKNFLIRASGTTGSLRDLCHLALALRWAENKIQLVDQKFIHFYLPKYKTNLLKQLNDNIIATDTGMEGLLALICLHKKSLIKKRWINLILSSQNSDGGWAWDKNVRNESHPHTTLLALWILLECEKS